VGTFSKFQHKRFNVILGDEPVTVLPVARPAKPGTIIDRDNVWLQIAKGDQVATLRLDDSEIDQLIAELGKLKRVKDAGAQ